MVKEMNVSPVEKRYLSFSSEIHAEGSNTAVSYVAALNKIDTALHSHKVFLAPNKSVLDIRDIKRLTELYELIKGEQKKPDGGIFSEEPSQSYWRKGFCSAAVKDFSRFLTLADRQQTMLDQFETADDAQKLADDLEKIKNISLNNI